MFYVWNKVFDIAMADALHGKTSFEKVSLDGFLASCNQCMQSMCI